MVCFARLTLGFSETPALNLSGFPVNYRCFTLVLIKLSEREKLWPQFVKKGGKGEGATKESLDIASFGCMCRLMGLCRFPWTLHHFNHLQGGPFCFPNVLMCVCCTVAGTLLVRVPCMLRKVGGSQGHGVAGSAPRREETGCSLRKAGNFLFWREGIQRTLSLLWIPSESVYSVIQSKVAHLYL